MDNVEKNSSAEIGTINYLNKNCWLATTLGNSPWKRCWYCQLKFRECPFFNYLIISSLLMLFSFIISFIVEGKILSTLIISVFFLILVYGYFFNKSTEKIIETNFHLTKAKEELEASNLELKKAKKELEKSKTSLEWEVQERTKELKLLTQSLEHQVEKRTKEFQDKLEELEQFHRLTVGRELKIVQLKEEIAELKKELEKYKKK